MEGHRNLAAAVHSLPAVRNLLAVRTGVAVVVACYSRPADRHIEAAEADHTGAAEERRIDHPEVRHIDLVVADRTVLEEGERHTGLGVPRNLGRLDRLDHHGLLSHPWYRTRNRWLLEVA